MTSRNSVSQLSVARRKQLESKETGNWWDPIDTDSLYAYLEHAGFFQKKRQGRGGTDLRKRCENVARNVTSTDLDKMLNLIRERERPALRPYQKKEEEVAKKKEKRDASAKRLQEMAKIKNMHRIVALKGQDLDLSKVLDSKVSSRIAEARDDLRAIERRTFATLESSQHGRASFKQDFAVFWSLSLECMLHTDKVEAVDQAILAGLLDGARRQDEEKGGTKRKQKENLGTAWGYLKHIYSNQRSVAIENAKNIWQPSPSCVQGHSGLDLDDFMTMDTALTTFMKMQLDQKRVEKLIELSVPTCPSGSEVLLPAVETHLLDGTLNRAGLDSLSEVYHILRFYETALKWCVQEENCAQHAAYGVRLFYDRVFLPLRKALQSIFADYVSSQEFRLQKSEFQFDFKPCFPDTPRF